MGRKVDAYDKSTGRKLPYKVPEHWFNLFGNLRKTPVQKAVESAKKADQASITKEG